MLNFKPRHRFSRVSSPLISLIILLFLFYQKDALGQLPPPTDRFSFFSIGKDQGLLNLKTTSLFQDSYGFIWIGTQGGLFRFDGNRCISYENEPDVPSSIPSNFISYKGFYEDLSRDLWIGTNDAGLAHFDRKSERFQPVRNQVKNKSGLTFEGISSLCGDKNGAIWIATMGGGLNHYFPRKDSFSNYVLPANRYDTLMGSNLILSLFLDQGGQLWIGTGNGAAMLKPDGTFSRFFPNPGNPHSLSSEFVYDIFQDHKKRIWLSTSNGLNLWMGQDSFLRFYPAQHPVVPHNDDYNLIYRVFEDHEGDFWLGTKAGLLKFAPDQNEYEVVGHNPLNSSSILEGEVHGIMQDRMGNLWFATNNGISVLNKKTSLFMDEEWPALKAFEFVQTQKTDIIDILTVDGRVWISSEQGLFYGNPNEPLCRFLPGRFSKLYVDHHNRLIAGTSQSNFYSIDIQSLKVIKVFTKELKNTYSSSKEVGLQNSCFAEDCSGRLWVGTKSGLNRLDPATQSWQQFSADPNSANAISNSVINDMLVDFQGNLWIATNNGVNLLNRSELLKTGQDSPLRFICYRHSLEDNNSIGNNRARKIYQDSRNWLWFGTDIGLHLLSPSGRWHSFYKRDGLPDNRISGIVEDDLGNIWVSTWSNGLSKYDIGTGTFFNISKTEGLQTNQFPYGTALKLKNGKLFFSGFQGVSCFDPGKIAFPEDTTPVYFTALRLLNQPVQVNGKDGILKEPIYMTREITLGYDQDVLTLEFAALNSIRSDKQVYRYRVLGFKSLELWQFLGGKREITLTNLFPGTYTLEVESTTHPDDRAHWESAATLTIRVRIPWLPLLGYSGMILVVLYVLYRLRLNRKLADAEAQRLKELDSVKTNLYTNITHEFRTPLTIILGLAEVLKSNSSESAKAGLEMIRRNGRQLLRLVNQMLDLAKADSGNLELHYLHDDIIPYLKYLFESYESLAKSKSIHLDFRAEEKKLFMDYDPERLQTVVLNLLSNAIKFTPHDGEIQLVVDKIDAHHLPCIRIGVQDTGPGIPPDKLPYIFDRFYQVDNVPARGSEGTGIGLALTRELVKLMQGSIHVQNNPGKGALFTVLLPISTSAEKHRISVAPVDVPDDLSAQNKWDAVESNSSPETERPLVLIVEDNPDVVRYLQACLQNKYQVEIAFDGQQGIDAAIKTVPDLVISDVMMPVKDGFELCRNLKSDERSSHIPIILLTAKADVASRIAGLKRGADAYLAKPFHKEELLVQMETLLDLRRKLQAHYQALTHPEKDAVHSTPLPTDAMEAAFLQKIKDLIEADFSRQWEVTSLAEHLFISTSQLHRKLKALTGMHTTMYVRSLRLSKAARLLLAQPKEKISTIAFNVGFENTQEFNRRFKEAYQMSPGEWRKRKN